MMKQRDIHRAELHRHDPYKARHKLPEPAACPECGAVFHEGRGQWVEDECFRGNTSAHGVTLLG
jgi:hypothetical protein